MTYVQDSRGSPAADLARRRWELVWPHRSYLLRIAIRRGLSESDAEDCAHEAMVRCVQFAGLDESRALEFLVSTTMRLCVDWHRRHARDENAQLRLGSWYADEPSPEDEVCDRAEAAWVAGQLAALPDTQRTALLARAEGLSCSEVAGRLALSYKSVESLLSRARTQARAALASTFGVVVGMVRRRRPAAELVGATVVVAAVVSMLAAPWLSRPSRETPRPQQVETVVLPGLPSAMATPYAGAVARIRPKPVATVLTESPGLLPSPSINVPYPKCDGIDWVPVVAQEWCPPSPSIPGDPQELPIMKCVHYGPSVGPQGFECHESPEPARDSTKR